MKLSVLEQSSLSEGSSAAEAIANTESPRLSVLDVGIIRTNQSAANAFSSMISLAQHAEKLGYHRYWLGEHHNIAAVVASQTAVFAAAVGAQTEKIPIGGCVLLSHYSPLLVAEQMSILEALYPGRVDLGLGRSHGTDQTTSALLQGGRRTGAASRPYSEAVQHLLAMLRPGGIELTAESRDYSLQATSNSTAAPDVWVLSTSKDSATLAARLGLPYAFGLHIQGEGMKEAIDLYRAEFKPSARCPEPNVMVSAIVVVGESPAAAERLARPQMFGMCQLRSGETVSPQSLVEDGDRLVFPERYAGLVEMFKKTWIVGDPRQARDQLRAMAIALDIDEVMINPVAAAFAADDVSRAPNRERTLTWIAEELGGGA
jgi:luciferase family oxidoreductase group 1